MARFILLFTCFTCVVCVFPHLYLYFFLVSIYVTCLLLLFRKNFFSPKSLVWHLVYILPCIWVVNSLLGFSGNTEVENSYMYSWVVVSWYRPWSFVLETSEWQRLLIYSEWIVPMWSSVQIVWNIIPAHVFTFLSGPIDPHLVSFSFSFEKWLLLKWFLWAVYAQHVEILWDGQLWYIAQLRKLTLDYVIRTYSNSSSVWLLLWLYIGDVSFLPKEVYDSFIASGLVHIVAVSWSNIYMLVVFLSALLFFLPYYFRIWCIVVLILMYCLLCGLDSSVFRALIMWYIIFISCVLGTSVSIYRSLTYAYVILLSVHPYTLLYDMGFLLSFCAVLWIVLSSKLYVSFFTSWVYWVFKWIHMYILPSVWATLWVVWPLILYIGGVNITSMVSNLVLVPLLPCVFIFSFLVYLVPFVYVHSLFVLVVEKMLDRVVFISYESLEYAYIIWYADIYWQWLLLFFWVTFWLCVYMYIRYKNLSM